MNSAERRDRYIAIAVAVVLHVAMVAVIVRTTADRHAPDDRSPERQASPASSHRDIPVAPDGIAVDSLPPSGLRQGANSQVELSLDCRYAVTTGSTNAALRSGDPAAPGVLGCPATLDVRDLAVPIALSAHYDVLGQLVGVVKDPLEPGTVEAVRNLELARPRRGRQWQGAVTVRLTVDRQ